MASKDALQVFAHLRYRHAYRGYHLEQKQMMVGWQVTITKDDAFVQHSGVSTELEAVMIETHSYIDPLLSQISTPSEG